MQKYALLIFFVLIQNCLLVEDSIAEGRGGKFNNSPYGASAISGAFILYGYAKDGELIDWKITKTHNGEKDVDWDITVYSPIGLVMTGVLTTSQFDLLILSQPIKVTSATAGIWTLIAIPRSTDSDQAGNAIGYDLSVYSADATPITGRVYTYSFHNYVSTTSNETFGLYFLTPDGYQYKNTYNQMNGGAYSIQSDKYGVRRNGSACISAYKSLGSNIGFGPETSNCGDLNRIFFNPPSSDLPASAPRLNVKVTGGSVIQKPGQLTETFLFEPVIPAITDLKFIPSKGCIKRGTINFTITNYSGSGVIHFDINNNGAFSDAIDRTDTLNFSQGLNTYSFNGLDGFQNPIPASSSISIRAELGTVGEIHFVLNDVEALTKGIEVVRLNGNGAPDYTLYWDDTDLRSQKNCSRTSQPDAMNGMNSSGGVHEWAGCNIPVVDGQEQGDDTTGAWGNNRLIDNWTFVVSEKKYAQIAVPASPSTIPQFTTIPTSLCQSKSATVLPTTSDNGLVGTWSPYIVNTSDTGMKMYTFTPSAGQCASATSVSITILPKPTGVTVRNKCKKDLPFIWNGKSYYTSATDTLEITNSNGCDSTDILNLTVSDATIPQFSSIPNSFCPSDSSFALPTISDNGIAGTWSPRFSTLEPETKTYTFISSPEQCALNTSVLITVLPSPSVMLGKDTSLCIGESLVVNAGTDFADYKWSTGDNTQSIVVSDGGIYSVQATAQNGCSSHDSIVVSYKSKPEFDLGKDRFVCQGDSLVLAPVVNTVASYLWDDGTTKPFYTVLHEGTYSLTASNECGSTTDFIYVSKQVICTLNFPSAFTPNGDGRNDMFKPVNAYNINNFHLVVFNRFGQKIFESVRPELGWDGSVHGKAQDPGTYIWQCTFLQNGTQTTISKTVVLIR